jgi:hypothetical protein
MRRTTVYRKSKQLPTRQPGYRPMVDALEERLPPGDVLLGGMLGKSWLTPAVTGFAAVPPQALDRLFDGRRPGTPGRAPTAHVGAVLLGGPQDFFLPTSPAGPRLGPRY